MVMSTINDDYNCGVPPMVMDSKAYPMLARALDGVIATGLVPKVAPMLNRNAKDLRPMMQDLVVREIPAFLASANPEVLPTLAQHSEAHIVEIERLLAGGKLKDFEFVKAHGRLRAEQHFPIEATLHAYRVGHKILSHWMREAALATASVSADKAIPALADFAIEYTDAVSTVFAAEYVTHARLLAETEGDRRNELLNILLNGADESDGKATRLLKRGGYLEQRQSFCVGLVQAADPTEMENPSRVQRMIDAINEAAAAHHIRALIGFRNNLVTVVFSDVRRISGWTAPQAKLASRLEAALGLLGPSVLVGISSDHPSTAFIPRALNEATIAFDFTSVAHRLIGFSALPIRRLLLHHAADYVQSALPSWIGNFKTADAKASGALSKTLRAYADADLGVVTAAKLLDVHPNTIYVRMEKIKELTGRDGQSYHDLTELLLALDCAVQS